MKFERDFLRYFEQVEAGDIVVCDKVAKAVMRALAEIRNPGQWHYSEAMAAKHIDFMQKFCYTAVGSAPKPIAFEPTHTAWSMTGTCARCSKNCG